MSEEYAKFPADKLLKNVITLKNQDSSGTATPHAATRCRADMVSARQRPAGAA